MHTSSASHVRSKLYWDAKVLLHTLRSSETHTNPAVILARYKAQKRHTLTNCKKIIASRYSTDYRSAFKMLDNIDRFAIFNYSTGAWSKEYDRDWRLSVHKNQVTALKAAQDSGLSLKECSDKFGVNFDGFHFSYFLYTELYSYSVIAQSGCSQNFIDFSGISANGSFIHTAWLELASTFAHSSMRHAKFYTGDLEQCIPGTHTFKMDFSGADLANADLRFSYLRGCDFSKATLTDTDFRDSNLFDCCFEGSIGKFKSTDRNRKGALYDRYLMESTPEEYTLNHPTK